ncbi:putative trypsin-6 [Armigeres subalbatus]|uniref:putative trypsin-6 n=1 Tax=Armigeres subalbatus TaxID=124917 RepID=UPI002ED55C0A
MVLLLKCSRKVGLFALLLLLSIFSVSAQWGNQQPQQPPQGQQHPQGQPQQQPAGYYPPNPQSQKNPQDGYYVISYPQETQGNPQQYPPGQGGQGGQGGSSYPSPGMGGSDNDDQQQECTDRATMVVGGTSVQWNDAPFMASLRDIANDRYNNFGNGHFCGGILISPYFVLTAASCIANRMPGDIGVVVGTLNRRKQASFTQLMFVQKMIPHPSYTFLTGGHDIGVILLKTSAFVGARVRLASLAYQDPRPGSECSLYGWGKTTPNGQHYSDCLRKAMVSIQDLEECKRNFERVNIKIPPSVFCAGFFGGGSDVCQGDIGGPVVCDGNLQGIINNKVGCGDKSVGKIYTNVYSFRSWIDYTINLLKSEFEHVYPEGSLDMRSAARQDAAATDKPQSSGVAEKCLSIGLALITGVLLLLA